MLRRSVLEFAVLVERMRERLLGVAYSTLIDMPLLQAKNAGVLAKSGRVGDAAYEFHGRGCRFELDSGEVVDFDFDPDGHTAFDAFRVERFLESRAEEWTTAEVERELALLTAAGVLQEVRSGWFNMVRS